MCDSPPNQHRSGPEPGTGYTLVEVVGVLAIIGILAAVVLSSVMTRIKLTQRQNEAGNLNTLADGLARSILRTRTVPSTNASGANSWVQVLVTELALPLNRVELNSSGNPRRLIYDPAMRLGTNNSQKLPWTQTVRGATNLISPRAVLVSSLMDTLPSLTGDTTTFSNLWNTPPDGVPAGWAASWASRGPDIKIKRMDFTQLFHRLVLENEDGLRTAPYSINTTNTLTSVPISSRVETFFLHGTPINLHFYPDPTTSTIVVLGHEYLVQESSYLFENGTWGRYLGCGPNMVVGSFGQLAEVFRVASVSGTRAASATPQSVADAMYTYLLYAALYSESGAPTDTPTPPVTPHLRMAYDAQLQMSLVSSNLLK
jgi:type II secretory pathway pseudopilin PulG